MLYAIGALQLLDPFEGAGDVYGLVDVRNPETIRYVGASIKGAKARVRDHMRAGPASGSLVRDWVDEIGTSLRYVILESVVPSSDLAARERYWIARLDPDLNVSHSPRCGQVAQAIRRTAARLEREAAVRSRRRPLREQVFRYGGVE